MTLGELQGYIDQMPPLKAEVMLDAAQVALYPSTVQFAPETAKSWWESLWQTVTGAASQVASTAATAAYNGPTFNGVPSSWREMKQKIAGALGGRFVA